MQKLLVLFEKTGQAIHKHTCIMSDNVAEMSIGHIKTLQLVSSNEQVAMSDIANHLQISPGTATSTVDKLVKEGWLKRQYDENDRRKVYLIIHEDREQHWKKFKDLQNEKVANFLGVLTDEQKTELISIMETLINQ